MIAPKKDMDMVVPNVRAAVDLIKIERRPV
jgi:hypothetical protein